MVGRAYKTWKVSSVTATLLLSPEDEELRRYCHWHGNYATITYNGSPVKLHRFILQRMGHIIPDDMVIDHINQIKLDNRRENLRVVTQSINCQNNSAAGVSKDKGKWRARVMRNYKSISLGYFNTREAAIEARNKFLAGVGI